MLPTLFLSTLLSAGVLQEQAAGRLIYVGDPDLPTTRVSLFISDQKLDPPKLSPKKFGDPAQPFEFEWAVTGMGRRNFPGNFDARCRVYSQERKAKGDVAPGVAREIMQLWAMNYTKLGLEHSPLFNDQVVDVYLCWGGKPGGEQLFDIDSRIHNGVKEEFKANTVYIYDLPSFKDPIEMCREVAHEYGHATLPAIGGFKDPEEWGNGYLGERLFLRWLRDGIKSKKLGTVDAMDASLEDLDAWVKKNVDPLVEHTAQTGVEMGMLEGTGPAALDSYMGLVLYLDTIFPPRTFAMSLRDTASTKAKDFALAIIRTIDASDTRIVLSLPAGRKGGLWVPVGKGKIAGAQTLKKKGDWAFILPGTGAVSIVPAGVK